MSMQEKSVTVSCQVFPLQQDTYASVHFFKDDVKMTQDPGKLLKRVIANGCMFRNLIY